jgi:translocation protein SEC62
MSAPGPSPNPQQLAQMQAQFLEEAKRRGLTPQQLQQQQRQQLAAEAAKQGLTLEQYVAQLKARAMQEHQMRAQQAAQAQAQAQQPGQVMQQIPVNPNAEKKPEALAVAKFLRSQDLKTRVCVLDGQRKDMFKGAI